jgi:hypothetical protein
VGQIHRNLAADALLEVKARLESAYGTLFRSGMNRNCGSSIAPRARLKVPQALAVADKKKAGICPAFF